MFFVIIFFIIYFVSICALIQLDSTSFHLFSTFSWEIKLENEYFLFSFFFNTSSTLFQHFESDFTFSTSCIFQCWKEKSTNIINIVSTYNQLCFNIFQHFHIESTFFNFFSNYSATVSLSCWVFLYYCFFVFVFFFDWTYQYLDNNIFIFTNMLFSVSHFNTNRIRLKFFLLALQFLGWILLFLFVFLQKYFFTLLCDLSRSSQYQWLLQLEVSSSGC